MDLKKVARTSGKVVFYAFTGIAGPSILKTASLLKEEARKTGDSAKRIRVLVGEARDANRLRKEAAGRDETFQDAEQRHAGVKVEQVYLAFLGRKRAALTCVALSLVLGLPALLHGHVIGLLPLLVGGAMGTEFAWLAEFRLWQLRGRKLSKHEGGSFHHFWRDKGAWIRTFDPEPGYGLNVEQRRYRRWLWVKRVALVCVVVGLLVAVDLFYSRSRASTGYALCVAGAGMSVALLVESHLRFLRFRLSKTAPVLALFRFESGACYKE